MVALQVNDGSMLSGLQIVVGSECEGYNLIADGEIHTGAAVSAKGELVESPGGKQKVNHS